MAWSIGDYNEFLEVVQDAFGVDRGDAQTLYTELRDVLDIGPLTVADLEEYADVASDLVVYEEPEEPELTPEEEAWEGIEFGDDDALPYDYEYDWEDQWLDVGDELEIAVKYTSQE